MFFSGPLKLAPGAMNMLMAYDWSGNVRELENVLERALILNKDKPLSFEGIIRLVDLIEKEAEVIDIDEILPLNLIDAMHIKKALKATHGKNHGTRGAAKLLGINPSTLRHRMRKLGVVYKPQKEKKVRLLK